ncbi:MAG: ABC transporter substrate-binding protein [Rhodoferax sp.]|jgi:tripartite-type tricarboxylate transporter receptor subunit TctC|nr:ABC transporter substrate-binding protein [Rhodoferax sp.]MBP9928589.1 ABC transporter substrate-binding protein [Rhodoferax sp.]HQX58822.1 tripartite tricarboxylate transporter substrate-binding protein [Burkholderiaceae bacterium]HQZ05045.1 tripartite tricarboxylate transporter substrate-binding protein [Burkholderiaceae bacterium]
MAMTRRLSTLLLGATALAAIAPLPSLAQTGKKLTILVGFPAGGAVDAVARSMTETLRTAGYTVIVENKTGAGGRMATDALLAAPADGQTIMLTPGGNLTIYPNIYSKLRYDVARDLVPIATACEFQFGLAAGPGTPAKTLKEFLVWAKANPGKASFGTPGAGTAMHFLGVQLAKDAQVELTHIPYRGGAPAMVDVIGGNLPALFTTLPNLLQQYKGGKLRILGFSGAQRMAALPEIPTFKEQGFPNLTMSEMFLFVAKAQTPPAQQKELASALAAAVRSKDVILALEKAEFEPLIMEQSAITKRLQAETANWAAVVKSTGYKAED